MRILVCGGRDYTDWPTFCKAMYDICDELDLWYEPDEYGNTLPRVTIIHGGAKGADSLADQWAVVNWTGLEEYKADWKTHGKAAGPIRNQQMLDEGRPDIVVAFPGGRGTQDMINRARKTGVQVVQPI